MLFDHTSCLILAAGNSERMGEPKALLKFDTGTTFIEKITNTYVQSGVEQIVIVVNRELSILLKERAIHLPSRVILVLNDRPDLGRFYSLKTGVPKVSPEHTCFLQNIDNPFTSIKILEELYIHRNEADVIVPKFQNRSGHPVLLSPVVLKEISSSAELEVKINDFLKRFLINKIETSDESILANINSLADYQNSGFIL